MSEDGATAHVLRTSTPDGDEGPSAGGEVSEGNQQVKGHSWVEAVMA